MEIIDNRIIPEETQFGDLDIGDIFEYDGGIIHMKIGCSFGRLSHNAVHLNTGFAVNLEYDTCVLPLKGKLIIT